MAPGSERKLQEHLHENGFYTQKAPSSGKGIHDPQTGEAIDQADLVAIRSAPVEGITGTIGSVPEVLAIEEKHVAKPTCTIEDHERQQLERIEAVTGGIGVFAVQWKHSSYPHEFFRIDDLVDTGKHWKITTETNGKGLHDIV